MSQAHQQPPEPDPKDDQNTGEQIFPNNDDLKNRQVPEGDTASADQQSEVGDRLQNVVENPGDPNPGEGDGPNGVTGGNEGENAGTEEAGEPPGSDYQKVTGDNKSMSNHGSAPAPQSQSNSPR